MAPIGTIDWTGADRQRGMGHATKVLVILALAIMSVAMLGLPAQAAGSTAQPDIRGCFTWGPSAIAYANQPVFLQYWKPSTGKWVNARSANTASNGCIQFNDLGTGGIYYHLVGYRWYGSPLCYYYYGASGYVGPTSANDTLHRTGYTQLTGPYGLAC